ncbi:EamA family transporter RarD [Consotaella salsifontis]|uniref:Chloramphenicol-sensitive protein RarD n=1 Tax=Consotaella salsifontis TaxID=1365950 RepID=A0A1T4T7L3_9HYPH|nr:EamA family transporter RarD [Consotaella salsifontis]SKA36211.1 chloramphenicol-sensitive protein RarD [Consotaella salsifontis]
MAAETEDRRGFLYALGAYGIWGFILPIYLKSLADVPPLEVLAHRIIWSLPVAVLILWLQGVLGGVWRHFRSPRTLALATLTATLVSVNWGTYIYAVGSGQMVAAALGYYVNPLLNVVLAAIFLGERPTRIQGGAIALAVIGVAVMAVEKGGLPWLSLVLALSFGLYGLIRKMVPVGASEGFFVEVTILFLPSLALLMLAPSSGGFLVDIRETALLVAAGPLTAAPLILYAAGARLLRFTTIGILQYLTPTCVFFIAVFVYGEPFSAGQLVAFAFIWSALALYTYSLFSRKRTASSPEARSGDEARQRCPAE